MTGTFLLELLSYIHKTATTPASAIAAAPKLPACFASAATAAFPVAEVLVTEMVAVEEAAVLATETEPVIKPPVKEEVAVVKEDVGVEP